MEKKRLSVIEFAIKRLEESISQAEDDYVVQYWRAYLDGATAKKNEDEKIITELDERIEYFKKVLMERESCKN